jgi:hypothetical protein
MAIVWLDDNVTVNDFTGESGGDWTEVASGGGGNYGWQIQTATDAVTGGSFSIATPQISTVLGIAIVPSVGTQEETHTSYQDGSTISGSYAGTLIAQCTASGSNTYILPTLAEDVSEVYIDFLPTDLWVYDPEINGITFPVSLFADSKVYAKYLYTT